MNFRVDLDCFRGPLELLLYLVRQHELAVMDVPIASIAEQYLKHLASIQAQDINAVGDFLEIASTLMEIKARSLLPQADEEDAPLEDPRKGLVEQLLEYKKYKDVASILEEKSRARQQCHPRLANDLPPREVRPDEQPIHDVELWDLVSAIGRIMRQHEKAPGSTIVYDDTPIEVYMSQIHERLRESGRMLLSEAFEAGMHKSAIVGLILAVLELVRHHDVEVEQDEGHGEITIRPGSNFRPEGIPMSGNEPDSSSSTSDSA